MAKSFSAADRRKTGLLVALAFALIALGVVLYVAIGQGGNGRARALPAGVVDIGGDPLRQGVENSSDPASVQQTGAARLQFVDKNDPNRVASELSYQKLDPVGQGYFTLTQPRAWVYLKDGRTLHIRADIGEVKMPSRTQQPESGEFRGKVQVRMFPPPVEDQVRGVLPIDPDRDEPALLAATDSIRFDTVLLELQTNDTLTVSSKQVLFEGEGLFVKGNEVRERIESLKTKGRFVRYNPTIRTERSRAKPAASAPAVVNAPASGPAPGSAEPAPPGQSGVAVAAAPAPTPEQESEQLYHLLVSNRVKVEQNGRTLRSDTLQVFARLVGGQFPEGAFGTPNDAGAGATGEAQSSQGADAGAPARSDEPGTLVPAPRPVTPASPSAGDRTAPLFVSAGDKDIVLTWTGTLELEPIVDRAEAEELAGGNHFTARFSADKPGGETHVTLVDPDTGATGTCGALEYRATQRVLSLMPRRTDDGPAEAVLDVPGSGRIGAPVIRADVASGLVTAIGPGSLTAYGRGTGPLEGPLPEHVVGADVPLPPGMERQVTWHERAEFQFRMRDGKITDEIELASLSGNALARERTSCLGGDYIQAEFISIPKTALSANTESGGENRTIAFKRVRAEGNVLAIAGPGGRREHSRELPAMDPYLTADRLDVLFTPPQAATGTDGRTTEPASAIATGTVRAVTRDESLHADRLEFALGRETGNDLEVVSARASGNVNFERADGVMARSDELVADPIRKTAELSDTTGRAVALARGPSTVIGKRIRLEEAGGTMTVIGSGAFEHRQVDDTSPAPGVDPLKDPMRVSVRWNDGMQFRNDAGTVECAGGAQVEATNAVSTQTVKADKIFLWLTPADNAAPGGVAATPALGIGEIDAGPGARRLLKAEAIGSIIERDAADGGADATIEVRRYAPSTPSPSPSSALALASAEGAPGLADGGAVQVDTSAAPAPAERVLEQLLYFKGPRIVADDVAGTITVPAAGTAIVRDQRADPTSTTPATAAPAAFPVGGTTRGTSRFIWGESALFTRSTGVLNLRKDVRIAHLPLGAANAITLRADAVDATLGNGAGASAGSGGSSELVRAVATGNVDAAGGTQRLLADVLEYDALAGTAAAASVQDRVVTVFDQQRGPVSARRVTWDLKRDRVDISEPAPIVAPR